MARDRAIRVALVLMLISGAVVGVWAQFAPHSFYDSFPGSGHHWVAVDGPYNEHLVRDVGGLYLALTAITLVAAVWLVPAAVRVAALGWLVFGVPHFVYHFAHRDLYGTSDRVGNLVSLGVVVVLPALVLALSFGWLSGSSG